MATKHTTEEVSTWKQLSPENDGTFIEAGSLRYAGGAKAQQREDKFSVNRQGNYSRYRYELSKERGEKFPRLYSTDIDFVEWTFKNGELRAAAVLDLTMVESGYVVNDRYKDSIIERFNTQMQGKCLTFTSEKFNCNGYIVLFRDDCSEFWLYNWSQQKGWKYQTAAEHEIWLEKIRSLV